MANTPIPSRAVEYSTRGTSKPREYTLTPEELEEIRQKYPATKADKNFKKPVAHNPRTDQRHQNQGEGKEMVKFKMTAEEYFAERQAGKSLEKIAEEHGVTPQTIDYHLKKWGSDGKQVEPDKTQLLREKETLPQQSVSHDMIKEYKSQLDQVKCALDESMLENERLKTELAEVKQMFDDAYQRNVNGNAKIGEHLQAIQELKAEVEHWQGEAERSVAIAGKADEQLRAELQVLQDEMNRMISERDELTAEADGLHRRMIEAMEEAAQASEELDKIREAAGQAPEPTGDVRLLDRSIADLTRARWILTRLSASGE